MEKTYTLGELLESPKGQEMLDENLDAHVDVDVVEAILELDYWKYDAEQKETFYTLDDLENAINDVDKKTYFMSQFFQPQAFRNASPRVKSLNARNSLLVAIS